MGADVAGKQELDTEAVIGAKLYADHPQQSVSIGEFQHAFHSGDITSIEDICPIGLVTQNKREGRTSASDITLFDSSGVAIQDLAIAREILDNSELCGDLKPVEF